MDLRPKAITQRYRPNIRPAPQYAILCALDHQTVLVESKMEGAKDPKYLITNSLRLEAQAILEAYSWRWLIEEFFGDEKKLLDFEEARVRNYQAGAITVSSMITKTQEENVQTLLEALKSEEAGDQIATKWLGVLKKRSSRYRRQRKDLCVIEEDAVFENWMTG